MNVALVEATVPPAGGPPVIVVSGAVVSIVKARDAGVGSGAPAALSARTSNVCAPAASTAVVNGEVHVANAALSTRHWKLAAPLTPVNVNVGVVSFVGPAGPPVIVVSSAATVNVRVAGVELGNAPSRTENV